MLSTLVFHHVGVVTTQLTKSARFYEALGYRASRVFEDPLQRVAIILMEREGSPIIELITPADEKSPAQGWLKRIESGPYHTCYETPELPAAIEALKRQGAMALSAPVPAVCFGGRRVVFLWSDTVGLLELLEANEVTG